MRTESRTNKSVKNAQIALIYYFINLALNFFSRKIFLNYLGTEILGLNTTVMNFLQFLNLAELGIGAAIGYSLYQPLACSNRQEVNEIVSVQGYLYRRIGLIIIGAAIILMLFFPYIFAKTLLPLWYAYATFIVLLIAALAGYFFNYRQIVLTADQKDYKLTIAVKSITAVKILLQILAIIYLPFGYIWWLLLEFIASVISVFTIEYTLTREYPWLKTNLTQGKFLKNKYPHIIIKTKQLFFHKIAGFALMQTSPLIIYAYTSLTVVAIYGNYMLITTGLIALLCAIFNSINAGIGNLVTEGNKEKILGVFKELFSIRFLMVATTCYGIYVLSSPFISLWIGEQYLIDNYSFILIIGILYMNTIRGVVDAYINAYGLFQDIWAPVTETVLNIGLSVLGGYFWGMPGILGGVLISLVLIVGLWKPYLLFRRGIQAPVTVYIITYIKHFAIGCGVFIISLSLIHHIKIDPVSSYLNLMTYTAIVIGIFFSLLSIILYITEQGMRDFINRIVFIIRRNL